MTFNWHVLTPAQQQCVTLHARGLSYKEIAVHRGVAYSTVKCHMFDALRRMGLNSAVRLVALAVKHGYVDPEAP
jgi:DNA-binding NarL/FixJ family response regulator